MSTKEVQKLGQLIVRGASLPCPIDLAEAGKPSRTVTAALRDHGGSYQRVICVGPLVEVVDAAA